MSKRPVQPQPHTGSYYAASLNDTTRYAALAGEHVADICVVGAGFTGVSTALHLAERGYKVHVVEANRVGWGASGRNGGQLIGGIAGEAAIAKHHGRDVEELFGELRWAGHDIVRERVETYEIECDLKSGYLDVALKPRHLRDNRADLDRLQNTGFPHEVRLLSEDETAELTGTHTYIGALLNMGNGHLHPLNLCAGEARAAVSLGASISEESPVVAIERGERPRVVTANGTVTADAVVLAGNAYHFLEPKLRGIMFPVNSFIVATEPLSEDVVNAINPRDLAICDPNFVLKYYRLSADKRLLFGGRFNYFGDDPAVIRRHHRSSLSRIYPALADVRFDYAWGGTIGVPVKRVPLLGRLAPNVFYSQGYSGHGVNVTHLAGRIMADAVAGTLEQFDMFANVKPFVVPGAHTFMKPMVSLGMMYYKIKDAL
ncbi:MAG: FAD-binding oxidoreductase [Gammaproteobacteria bacterium]|nr:FAD-binding oxidoreductase [Gammaproteobacteria bacterium]